MAQPDNIGLVLDMFLWALSAVCFCVGLFAIVGGLLHKGD